MKRRHTVKERNDRDPVAPAAGRPSRHSKGLKSRQASRSETT
jgi:hypothetical protein